MAKVKIIDVAREAGVSLGTVSNALNHPEKVRPDTLQHINETIRRLGYVPNQSARQLAGGRNAVLGLVLPRLDHGFSLQIANGAHCEARKHGFDLLITNAGNERQLQDHYIGYFTGSQVAGILVQPMPDDAWQPPAAPSAMPAVWLNVSADGPGYFVAADNAAQGRIVAEHAIACGAEHITVIGHAAYAQLRQRVAGMHGALEHRPDIKIEVIDAGEADTAADGYSIGRQLAERGESERPDFIIGLTDVLAAGAVSGVESVELSVPGDIQVCGCDGNPLAWSGSVPLTTCAPLGYEVGRRGVQLLIEQIERERERAAGTVQRTRPGATAMKDEPVSRHEIIRPFLLERASTRRTVPNRNAPSSGSGRDINLGTYL